MIKNRKDLKNYIEEDFRSLRIKGGVVDYIFHDIWRFQVALRRLEYHTNVTGSFYSRIMKLYLKVIVRRKGRKLGFSIPENVFGPGLAIAHAGTIVVNSHAKVGANCRIHVCVNIGADISDGTAAPHIGDNVYIGPGAKIFSGIIIGDNVAIGANSVVNKSFKDGNCTIAGVPAKVVSHRGVSELR